MRPTFGCGGRVSEELQSAGQEGIDPFAAALALAYAGKKADAQKHFARAAVLDLTPSEKSELAGQDAAPSTTKN